MCDVYVNMCSTDMRVYVYIYIYMCVHIHMILHKANMMEASDGVVTAGLCAKDLQSVVLNLTTTSDGVGSIAKQT